MSQRLSSEGGAEPLTAEWYELAIVGEDDQPEPEAKAKLNPDWLLISIAIPLFWIGIAYGAWCLWTSAA